MDVKLLGQGGQQAYAPDIAAVSQNTSVKTDDAIKKEMSGSDIKKDTSKVSEADVKGTVDKLNKALDGTKTHAEYEVYGKSKEMVINIVDNSTKKIIQEIPPKKIIDMIENFSNISGIIVDKKS